MLSAKGLLAVIVTAAFLSVPIYFYWGFLTKGMQPTESTLRLNQLEKSGVPDFTLPDLNGKSVSLSQFRGKLVIVNIWASWCGPCVKEFPSLKKLVEEFKGELVVLAVSQDNTREDLDSFIAAFGSVPKDFVIVWDKDRITSPLLGVSALPESFILKKDGSFVRKIVGEQAWDDPEAIQFFKGLSTP
jgi:cytochrome c biogenesis protein CcmG/thiol:disulfide interchange protein DsbE